MGGVHPIALQGFGHVLNRIEAQKRLSMTYGQGKDMAAHARLTEATDVKVYFADSPSTICRELQRNTGKRGYRPKQAQAKAENRRKPTAKPLKMTPEAIALIDPKIIVDWSPGQISGWLKQERGIAISHERIYRHIWTDKLAGGSLHTHLRHGGKKRKQYGSKDKRGQIRGRAAPYDSRRESPPG